MSQNPSPLERGQYIFLKNFLYSSRLVGQAHLNIQGDPSGCSQGVVAMKRQVALYFKDKVVTLKGNLCFGFKYTRRMMSMGQLHGDLYVVLQEIVPGQLLWHKEPG